ncbi:MAG: CoA transferase, partial [Acidobacteriota bacterium]
MTGDDPVQVPPALALDAAAPTHAPPRDGDTATDDAPTAAGDPRVAQPLSGIVVLDLSRYLPGPLTARILADLGARVIKIEEPRMGDPVRQAPPVRGDTSSLAALLLGGVESLAIDLTTDLGRDALEQLMGEADVLLESFRPGTMARFGLDPAALRQRHPHLVICSISGWGQDGPTRTRAGHDLSYQAIAGTLAAGPAGAMPAVPTADVVGAWSAATSILAALVRRAQRTEDGVVRADPPSTTVEASAAPAADAPRGDGVWIDASLLDAAAHAAITAWAAEADQAHAVGDPLPLTGALPGYNLYRTADDGHVALAVLEPRFWTRFCQQVERPDLIPRSFSRDPVVRDKVARIIAGRTRSAWATFFAAHDLPGAP